MQFADKLASVRGGDGECWGHRTAQAVRTLAIAQREPSVTINHARFLDYRPLVERRPRENSVPKTAYATNLPPPGCAS